MSTHKIIIPVGRSLTADDSIYGVRIVGFERDDGTWDAQVEFESRSGIQLAAPADSHDNVTQLRSWADEVGEDTLQNALTRASIRPIKPKPR